MSESGTPQELYSRAEQLRRDTLLHAMEVALDTAKQLEAMELTRGSGEVLRKAVENYYESEQLLAQAKESYQQWMQEAKEKKRAQKP